MRICDMGWVVQYRNNPAGEWITDWKTADYTIDDAIYQQEHVDDWDTGVKWGMVRCVRCHAEEVTP